MLIHLLPHRSKQKPPRTRPPAGSHPGTLAMSEAAPASRLRVLSYDEAGVVEHAVDPVRPEALRALVASDKVLWVDVQGLGTEDALRAVGAAFGVHPLALADVVNTAQRPKTEEYDEHRYFVSRMVRRLDDGSVDSEQFSLFLGRGYVLTFQEHYGDVFGPVRERLDKGKGSMRRSGPDYLAYALIDALVDGYYPVLEAMGDALERLEEQVLERADEGLLGGINHVRRELLLLRRAVHPQRDAVNALIRDEEDFVTDQVRVYLRDCYDHCVQLADSLETLRELAAGLLNTYLSAVANRTNEIMKVLTIMASIFIPLTFLAGVYGMNFDYMPELRWRWAYPTVLAVMAAMVAGLVLYLRHLGWIGSRERASRRGSSS